MRWTLVIFAATVGPDQHVLTDSETGCRRALVEVQAAGVEGGCLPGFTRQGAPRHARSLHPAAVAE